MKLIIVESPTKAKTISKFLDKNYLVKSSFGHIRDLPKNKMGIDIAHDFKPQYTIPAKAKKTLASLKADNKKCSEVILASDEDREGEAIAWHLTQALKLDENKTKRIVFHEITKEAILKALDNPRQINFHLVDAQQARRILDRLVGYELSPFLWKKVAKGLSAGRVQSVATRLIVEKEKERQAFVKEEYWSISADFADKETKNKFSGDLYKIDNKTFTKLSLKKEQAIKLEKLLKNGGYVVDKIKERKLNKQANPPFSTSALQQSANRYLGFSAKQTMMLAQKLYEQGYITYMRTDSLNLSAKFTKEAQLWLTENLGKEYRLITARTFKNKSKNAQEAHEAIRPTKVHQDPDSMLNKLEHNQERLYRLIWQRAVASQMPAAQLVANTIDTKTIIEKKIYLFKTTGQTISFPGYLKVWPEKTKEQILPNLNEGEIIKILNIHSDRHETTPPARYSDATLVKELEKHGIGRPSTYAPTINTIITRNYVRRDENKKLEPSSIAFIVIDLLTKHFSKIVDYGFTANMENDLDAVAKGEKEWMPVISNFYYDFHNNLENKTKEINKKDIMPEEKSDEVCDKCGAPMIIKTGRYGKFLACSAYPECKNIKSLAGEKNAYPKKEPDANFLELEKKYKDEVCDKCGAAMKLRNGKYGPFLGCSAYPKCKNIKNISSEGEGKDITCPKCNKGKIVKKFSRRGAFWACNNYPDCKNAYWGQPTGEKCPNCKSLLLKTKSGGEKCSNKECDYEK